MQKLFVVTSDFGSSVPIPAGATMNITHCSVWRCKPLSVRVSPETLDAFALLEFWIGLERMLAIYTDEALELTTKGGRSGSLLEAGQDFWIKVRNDAEGPQHFSCEVWGHRP